MKFTPRTFRIQWDLHAWVGVLASLALFVVFFCGVFALFREELEIWQDPLLHTAPPAEAPPSFDALLAHVAPAPRARGLHVGFLTHEETRLVTAYLFEPTGVREFWVDPLTGASRPAPSRLASELYWLHFFYRVPWGQEASGLLAVALLATLVSGLVIHLKDLRRQWWTFRPTLKPRFSASDAHKVLGVFGLPFTAVMGWTGAILCLSGLLTQGLTTTVFKGDAQRVSLLRGYAQPQREETKREAVMLPLDTLVARARTAVPGAEGTPRYVDFPLQGDANAWVGVYFQMLPLGADHYATLDAVSGEPLTTSTRLRTPTFTFERVIFDLHYAHFGGLLLKLLYALLALAVCAVLLTGNLVWLERRDAARAHVGNRLLERLTAGVCAGLVLGCAVYCVANRALPGALERRADWEWNLFLGAWALAALGALVPRWSARRAGAWLCAGAAVLFAGVVAGDVVLQPVHLFTALTRGQPPVFIAQVLLCLLALGCAAVARGLGLGRPRR